MPGALVAALALLVLASPVRPASAADVGSSPLDRPLVDAAFVERGPTLPPDVLTVEVDDDNPANIRLALLRRDTTWTVVADGAISLRDTEGGYPWLLSVADDRVALMSITGRRSTLLYVITVDVAGLAIRVGAPTEVELAATDGGVADILGSEVPEIVLAGPPPNDPDGCGNTTLAVLEGTESFETASIAQVKLSADRAVRLAGASLGNWDEKPGKDLLVHVFEPCPLDENSTETHHLAVVRLADLQVVTDVTEPESAIGASYPAPPLAFDVDGDGRDEALIDSDEGPFVLDPVDGWRHHALGPAGALVRGSASPPGGAGTVVSTMRWSDDLPETGVAAPTVTRDSDGRLAVSQPPIRPIPDVTTDNVRAAWAGTQILAYSQQRPATMLTDLDGDGCRDMVAPLAELACAGAGAVAAGSTWLGTRPLRVVGSGADRRLLVATSMDWYPFEGGPVAPSPEAGRALGTWRTMPGNRFVLGEAPLPTLDSGPASVKVPSISRTVSKDGVVELHWPVGSRLMVRAQPVAGFAAEGLIRRYETQADFLYAEAVENEYIVFFAAPTLGLASGTFVANSAPDVSGNGDSFTWRLPLASTIPASAPGQDRWFIAAAALDVTGSVSDPVVATAIVDTNPPKVEITTPMVSAPWPFGTTIAGTAEPGASIAVPGLAPVVVGPDGKFELPAQLAPWPQTIKATAIDEAGNEAVATASVMGGVDIRGLPWPAIGVVAVLAGALVTSLRGVRGGPRVRPVAAQGFDEVTTPEIEELPGRPGPGD